MSFNSAKTMSTTNAGMSRRSFIAVAGAALAAAGALGTATDAFAAGAATKGAAGTGTLDKLVMVWLPNESSSEFDAGREEFGKRLSDIAGIPVELMTTTDYNIAIEAIASGKAQLANMGAEGFTQAQKKNAAVKPLVTQSDANGTLDGAKYYSRICVPADQLAEYQDGDGYSIQNIKGKRMSFVSASSTSGFKVPSTQIVNTFGLESTDDLTKPGFFSEVLFGNTHPGSAVNLLQGDADVAAFDDIDVDPYLDIPPVSGEQNTAGAIYQVKADAAEPFDRVRGAQFGIILPIPVLNGPIAVNTEVVPADMVKKLQDGLTSADTYNDDLIFGPADNQGAAVWSKKSTKGFIVVEDAWYDPIRALENAGANADTTAGKASSAADKKAAASSKADSAKAGK